MELQIACKGENLVSTMGQKEVIRISDADNFVQKFMIKKPLIKQEIQSDFSYMKLEPQPLPQLYDPAKFLIGWDFRAQNTYSLKAACLKTKVQKEYNTRVQEIYRDYEDPFMRNLVIYAIAQGM